MADELLDLAAYGLKGDAEGLEALGGHTLTLVDQPEQDVLSADVIVVEQPRLFLGEYHDPSGPVGEPLEQRAASCVNRRPPSALSVPVARDRPRVWRDAPADTLTRRFDQPASGRILAGWRTPPSSTIFPAWSTT